MRKQLEEWILALQKSERPSGWRVVNPVVTRCPTCGLRHETRFMNSMCRGCYVARKGISAEIRHR